MEKKLVNTVHLLHDRVCDALGNPCRVMILNALREHHRSVTDMATDLSFPQSSVSRHLRVLRDRGLVSPRREGSAVYYERTDMRVIEVLDLLHDIMTDRLNRLVASVDGEYTTKRQIKTPTEWVS
ncbi:MAG: winged helix-turn-helix transcriptional regulator [Chloroflexi bacterium]|nr:winged helix-turn-helix transcriptional regulator [Chloroflexota bacterium]